MTAAAGRASVQADTVTIIRFSQIVGTMF